MLEQLLSVMERRRLEAPFSEADLVDTGFRGFAEDVVPAFAGVDSSGVVAALRMVIAERLDRPPPRLDLVWTGPETRASGSSSQPSGRSSSAGTPSMLPRSWSPCTAP